MATVNTDRDKWALGLLAGIFAAVGGLGLTGLTNLGGLAQNVAALNDEMADLGKKIGKIAEQDMADVRARLAVLEARDLVAEMRTLEQRVRELEQAAP